MSYILDALRKSEEARRRQQGPDLSLADSTGDPAREPKSRVLPLLALALLVNAAVLGIWLLRTGTTEPASPLPESAPRPETAKAQPALTLDPAPPAAAPMAPQEPAQTARPAADRNALNWRQQPIKRIDDLSPSSRSRLPSLAISTHIYSDEPRHREVSINGRRYQEGDSVAGLALLEITETGVLLGFEEQVIRLDLQDEWGL